MTNVRSFVLGLSSFVMAVSDFKWDDYSSIEIRSLSLLREQRPKTLYTLARSKADGPDEKPQRADRPSIYACYRGIQCGKSSCGCLLRIGQ